MYGNNYGVYDGGYQGGMGHGYMTGAHWIAGPLAVLAALIGIVIALIWLILVIWALIDLAKHKPAHSTAWVFVIIFGHFMGPVGYYFIVARDRKKVHVQSSTMQSTTQSTNSTTH